MFNSLPALTSSLSLGKIIGGVSKTLTIANQLIPLYQKAKPMISNAKTTFGILKEIVAKPKTTVDTSLSKKEIATAQNTISTSKKENQPVFFL